MKGGKSIKNLKRPIHIKMRVTEAERDLIAEKMTAAGIRNREAYLRKTALDSFIVRLDLTDVREMVRLLSNATNNLNQIARRANETRSVYESDIRNLRENYERLWEQSEAILRSLAKIQR